MYQSECIPESAVRAQRSLVSHNFMVPSFDPVTIKSSSGKEDISHLTGRVDTTSGTYSYS
jgi:hypothetical protein